MDFGTKIHMHHYVIAGKDPESITECKVFSEYKGASAYAKILVSNGIFPYICVRKQACLGDSVEFQDCWAVQR